MRKVCRECREVKLFDDFYKMAASPDGLMYICKRCHKGRMKKNRLTNPAVQEYDRARAKMPHRKEHARAVTIQWRRDHPEAYRAQTAVGNALRDGKLFKGPCAECGTTDEIHAHHSDYSKPLDVTWLCPLHHHRLHAEIGDCHGATQVGVAGAIAS